MRVKRFMGLCLAAVMLLAAAPALADQSAAVVSVMYVSIGRIENGVWRLDPSQYTYRKLQQTTELNLSGKGITAVEGLEHLAWLTSLDLSHNSIEHLDLSACRKLTDLNCSDNRLTSLDLSACGRLKTLDCSDNALGQLSVNTQGNLQVLDCRNCGLTGLDVSRNGHLTELYCSGNQLSALELRQLKNLQVLDVASTGLAELDLSRNSQLTALSCAGNPELRELTLKLNPRLCELHTEGTGITFLNLTGQGHFARMLSTRAGYRYEEDEGVSRTWSGEMSLLSVGPLTTAHLSGGIILTPAGEGSGAALPGCLGYKPGEFTKLLLSSDYEQLCHYFGIRLGPSGNIYSKANESWFYENAHTVVPSAGLAVETRLEETNKEKSAFLGFTVFDAEGNFRFRCTLDYMPNEDAVAFARRLNRDHTTDDDEDLWGYTGQVMYYACGNALIILEGIPSAAQARTPTLESYLRMDTSRPMYVVNTAQ